LHVKGWGGREGARAHKLMIPRKRTVWLRSGFIRSREHRPQSECYDAVKVRGAVSLAYHCKVLSYLVNYLRFRATYGGVCTRQE
jgi:hypothetical protein